MPHFVNEINLCTSTHDENSYTNIDFFLFILDGGWLITKILDLAWQQYSLYRQCLYGWCKVAVCNLHGLLSSVVQQIQSTLAWYWPL